MAQIEGWQGDIIRMGAEKLTALNRSALWPGLATRLSAWPADRLASKPLPRMGWSAVMAALPLTALSGAISTKAQAQVFTEPARPAAQPSPKPRTRNRPTPTVRPERIPSPRPSDVRAISYSDPVSYCAAYPETDQPTSPYSGPPVPNWVASALAGGRSGSVGNNSYNWRCMGRRVMACASPTGQNQCEKPSQDREPTVELQQYCTGKRRGEVPNDIAGNTVPRWACNNGKPTITGYRAGLDPRGYLSEHWSDVTDLSPANMVGQVPRAYVGAWHVASRKGTGFLSVMLPALIEMRGGRNVVGSVRYGSTIDGNTGPGCAVDVTIGAMNATSLQLNEASNSPCGVLESMTMQPRDGKMWIEWRKQGATKVRSSGWGQRSGG